jgi:hypothetical protein
MSNPILIKNYTAGGAIGANLLVKWSADFTVVAAAAAADRSIGVTRSNVTTASGDPVDVVVKGEYEVKAGGTIARGDPITSDASGQGVTAAPAGVTNNPIVGYAKQAAVIGDLFLCDINPQTFQG